MGYRVRAVFVCASLFLASRDVSLVFAAANPPDERAPEAPTVCRGGTRGGQACSLEPIVDTCANATECDGGETCEKGFCSACPGGQCVVATPIGRPIKGTLTLIMDEHVSAGATDEPTAQGSRIDSDTGTKAFTVLLELKAPGGLRAFAETYQNINDPTDEPAIHGWNQVGSDCLTQQDSACVFERDLLENLRSVSEAGEQGVDRRDLTVFLFQRPEETMLKALRYVFGRTTDEIPLITRIGTSAYRSAFCDDSIGDVCPPELTGLSTPEEIAANRIGSTGRVRVILQWVKVPAPVTAPEDLTPCLGVKDRWTFNVSGGGSVVIGADTSVSSTAADLVLEGSCEDGTTFDGDDDVNCTFPPPSNRCPRTSFATQAATSCTVDVLVFQTGPCSSAAEADYTLSVTGGTGLALTADDVPN
jgi:hypothetical protein